MLLRAYVSVCRRQYLQLHLPPAETISRPPSLVWMVCMPVPSDLSQSSEVFSGAVGIGLQPRTSSPPSISPPPPRRSPPGVNSARRSKRPFPHDASCTNGSKQSYSVAVVKSSSSSLPSVLVGLHMLPRRRPGDDGERVAAVRLSMGATVVRKLPPPCIKTAACWGFSSVERWWQGNKER